ILPTASGPLPGGSDGPSYGTVARPAGVLRRLQRHPIWSCSVRGFACHRRYRRRGALLPHLFTLTSACPAHLGWSGGAVRLERATTPRESAGHAEAVFFLCHCPSGCPARALPGALPFGVRTFLPPSPFRARVGKLFRAC